MQRSLLTEVYEPMSPCGRTVRTELFIASASERVYPAFTEASERERQFVTNAAAGVNLIWENDDTP